MAATAFEHGDFVRAALSEMINRDFQLKQWKLWASMRPHYLVIDAKTGFDVLTNETQTTDRKIQPQTGLDREHLRDLRQMGAGASHDRGCDDQVVQQWSPGESSH